MRTALCLSLLLLSGTAASAQPLRDSVIRLLEQHAWRSLTIDYQPLFGSGAGDTTVVELRDLRFTDSSRFEGTSYTYVHSITDRASSTARVRGTLHIESRPRKVWITMAEDSVRTTSESTAALYPQQGNLTLTRNRQKRTYQLYGKVVAPDLSSYGWITFLAVPAAMPPALPQKSPAFR